MEDSGKTTVKKVLDDLLVLKGFDFTGLNHGLAERRITRRMEETKSVDLDGYCNLLKNDSVEWENLINVLTINVTYFFREPLTIEYLYKIILPEIARTKRKQNNDPIRIWSAGCSTGEEAYTVAILLKELAKKEKTKIDSIIFATDIDKNALKLASKGIYGMDSVKFIKYGILQDYFKQEDDQFILNQEIKEMVQFSFFDLLDKRRIVPPESIFGGFDLVLCRNVLIYFDKDRQKEILMKLSKSLKQHACLVLGEAETQLTSTNQYFSRDNYACKIFRKNG